jgi:hypothetical protein
MLPPQIAQPDQTLPPQLGGEGDPLETFKANLTPEQVGPFQQWFNNQTPEQVQQFMSRIGTEFNSAAGDAQQDMSRADRLRQGAPTSGGAVGPSGVYVGSSPLEHIAQVMNNKQRDTEYGESRTTRDTAREEQTARNVQEQQLKMKLAGIDTGGAPAATPEYQGGGSPFARSAMLRQNR